MRLWIEFHDSEIKGLKKIGNGLEIEFKAFVILEVHDQFGQQFVDRPYRTGTITLSNARYQSLPGPGTIYGGTIFLKDMLQYGNLFPIDLEVPHACAVSIEQGGVRALSWTR